MTSLPPSASSVPTTVRCQKETTWVSSSHAEPVSLHTPFTASTLLFVYRLVVHLSGELKPAVRRGSASDGYILEARRLNMLPPIFRDPGDDQPSYGGNSPYFTLEVHHGGNFYEKPNNLVYEGGFVLFIDYFQAAWFTKENLMKFLRAVGNHMVIEFYYKKQSMSLGKGLTRLASERDIEGMLMDREGHSVLQIYVVAPIQSYALPLHAHEVDDEQPFKDCYVPVVEENQGAEAEGTWADQFFEQNAEELWSQYEESLQYNYGEDVNVGDMSAGMDEVVVEDVNEEQSGGEEVEGLVESDYEMEHELPATGEAGSQRVNFDFGFGAADAQQVRDCDTDYGDYRFFKGLTLKNCLWDAARATTVLQWLQHMQRMLDLDHAAYEWLESKPASHWSKSHFREGSKCDMLLNNLCESFNSTIVGAREKPILTMLEEIRIYLMKRIVARRESSDRWIASIGPRIQKILDKNSVLARFEWAEYAGNERFQVRQNAGTVLNAVDLRARTCTCRGWQLSGIPCCHVIASVASRGLNVVEYVDDIYKKETYLLTYTPSISPITGPDAWPTPGLNPLDPPVYTRRAGRPKKNRRKEPNEVASSQSQRARKASSSQSTTGASSGPRKRAGMIMTCRKCGERGHNSRSCKGAPPPARN